MKNEIIQKLGAVINALNNVYVKGEQNLANLSGSITILKEVAEQLGYSNANNFMRMFVKTTGMTVTQYLNRPEN